MFDVKMRLFGCQLACWRIIVDMVGSHSEMEEVACTKYSTPGGSEGVKSEKSVCVIQEYYSYRGSANEQRERERRAISKLSVTENG
jgi:hypothetical protein